MNGSRLLAQNARIWGSSSAIRRGVNTRDSSFRCRVWVGGSSKMNMPGGIVMPARMKSEERAAAGDEGLVVGEDPLDVLGPAHREEVVRLVVVERCLFA